MHQKGKSLYPWDKQPGEGEKAHEAFLFYKNLGAGRTLAQVSREMPKCYQLLKRWKKENNWKERVDAFDRYNERARQIAAQKDQIDMDKRHIKIGLSLQKKGVEALEATDAKRISAGNIKKLLRYGVDLEREARSSQERRLSGQQETSAANMLAMVLKKAWSEEDDE